MQRMHIELSWPRLVGIASGVFGGSLVLSSAAEFWEASSFRAHGSARFGALAYRVPFSLSGLSALRRTSMGAPCFSSSDVFCFSRPRDLLHSDGDSPGMVSFRFASSPPSVYRVVCPCRHPHATHCRFARVSSSRRGTRFPSPHNHLTGRWSERRTAVRSTFEMTSTLPLRATRVLVRRRSSCSR